MSKVYSFVFKPEEVTRSPDQLRKTIEARIAQVEDILSLPAFEKEVKDKNYLRSMGGLNIECSDKVYQELKKIPFMIDCTEIQFIKPKVIRGKLPPGWKSAL